MIDGKVLLIRRSRLERSSAGYWEFPKGRVEFGEHPETALKREFMEETGLRIDVGPIYRIYSHTYSSSSRPGLKIHLVEIEYLVDLADGENLDNLKLDPKEHDSWRLVDRSLADKLDPIYDDKKASLLSLLES